MQLEPSICILVVERNGRRHERRRTCSLLQERVPEILPGHRGLDGSRIVAGHARKEGVHPIFQKSGVLARYIATNRTLYCHLRDSQAS